ncbi:MAG: preprotein translocase subunit SecY [Gemmatimonadetes bacterium]|nr:preprotein translocase subunit SecY [Gemmatimonadota bacterium]MCY3679589.1 preprotein translocase subunit SecY [Gemmatimonadota bacterium]MYA42043.1 preprotein translocase subunit SecY [Gemmatimonadota bacterium]MYE92939.1 preprotein translocase subunit SecY [Gemmatimonadota bacterium]MYJ08893.1 preprotein translocase subunit SecY [Gemmatimonadota bacterium]
MANPIPNLFRAPELKKKILFTLLIMFVYRIGSHITVPGVDVGALQALSGQFSGTFLGVYDMFVGGGLSRATVFALGIMPYISASIMFQLLAAVFPTVEKLQKEGEQGRKKLTQWTRYTTVLLCLIQSYAYASFLQSLGEAVRVPGMGFVFSTVITLTVGGIFIMWMGEQITERGIGNGMSLMIFFSIIQGFPQAIVRTWESLMIGEIGLFEIVALLAVVVGITAGVVAMTMAARKIPVQIPRKVVGRGRIREGQKSFIPLRINSAGVMPIIFAQSFIVVPGTLAAFSSVPFIADMADIFQPGNWAYYLTYAALIIFFTYFYTAIIFNPVDLAENLKKQGAFIPGVKPGTRTAEYIDRILTRVTLPGSVYLALIALVPFWIFDIFAIQNFFFGGTSLLIVVGVGLDTVQQAQQHLLLRHYDGFMKKGRVKMRGRQRYV